MSGNMASYLRSQSYRSNSRTRPELLHEPSYRLFNEAFAEHLLATDETTEDMS